MSILKGAELNELRCRQGTLPSQMLANYFPNLTQIIQGNKGIMCPALCPFPSSNSPCLEEGSLLVLHRYHEKAGISDGVITGVDS